MRLTRDEITLVVVILLTLVVGAGVKHYRHTHRQPSAAAKVSGARPPPAAEP